jgi:DNA-binding MurR/RpiR family transcriptional regulator
LRLGRRLEQIGDDPAAILDHVLNWHIELLEEARHTLRPEAFSRAIEILHCADRILTFGIGPSAMLADYMTLKLARFGRQAAAVTGTGMGLADALLTMRRGDAMLLMDYTRVYREVEATLARATEVGVPVILLTDNLGPELADRVEVALQAARGRSGVLGSVVITMALLDALLLGLANRDRGPSLAALESLNDLRAKIVGYRIDVDPGP